MFFLNLFLDGKFLMRRTRRFTYVFKLSTLYASYYIYDVIFESGITICTPNFPTCAISFNVILHVGHRFSLKSYFMEINTMFRCQMLQYLFDDKCFFNIVLKLRMWGWRFILLPRVFTLSTYRTYPFLRSAFFTFTVSLTSASFK